MEPELQKYYEDRFSMFSTQGWKDLKEDILRMRSYADSVSNVTDAEAFHRHKGMIEIMDWFLSLEQISEQAYEELKTGGKEAASGEQVYH